MRISASTGPPVDWILNNSTEELVLADFRVVGSHYFALASFSQFHHAPPAVLNLGIALTNSWQAAMLDCPLPWSGHPPSMKRGY